MHSGDLTQIHTDNSTHEKWLRRKQAAELLREHGFPSTTTTLNTQASRGNGPPFRVFGRIPLHKPSELIDWAKSKLSAPRGSTSEADESRSA